MITIIIIMIIDCILMFHLLLVGVWYIFGIMYHLSPILKTSGENNRNFPTILQSVHKKKSGMETHLNCIKYAFKLLFKLNKTGKNGSRGHTPSARRIREQEIVEYCWRTC
jgi:hypothetical protein